LIVRALTHGREFLNVVREHRASGSQLIDLLNRQQENVFSLCQAPARHQLVAERKREAATATVEQRLFEASPLSKSDGGLRPAEDDAQDCRAVPSQSSQ
jgi:hypothetical protein